MVRYGKRQRGARQSLIFGQVCFLVAYFLNLCTLSPLVHADALRRAAQTKHPATHHCSSPGAAASTATSSESQQPSEPLCCEVRSGHNKAIFSLSSHLTDSPLFVCVIFPPSIGTESKEMLQQFLTQELHSAHSPPLYLFLAVLLI
jgi:hypothetical protein